MTALKGGLLYLAVSDVYSLRHSLASGYLSTVFRTVSDDPGKVLAAGLELMIDSSADASVRQPPLF